MSVFVIKGKISQLRNLKFGEKEVLGSLSRLQPSDGEEEEEEEDGWEEGEDSEGGGCGEEGNWGSGRGGGGGIKSRPPEEGLSRSLRKAQGTGGGTGKRCKRRSSASSGSESQTLSEVADHPHSSAHRAAHHHHHRTHISSSHHHHHCAASESVSSGHLRPMEQEKRIRREIANSNERRRMQSINAGFQSLRTLLPHHEGEKLSKAAILQQTAEYIYQLEQEKTRLLSQNSQLKRLVNQHEGEASSTKKRKLEPGAVLCASESSSADEGIGSMSPEPPEDAATNAPEMLRREMIELRVQLDRERRLRMHLEDQVRSLETQLYPERIREITQQVQLQYQRTGPNDPPMEVHSESICVKQEASPIRTAVSPPPSLILPPPSPISQHTPIQQGPTIHIHHSSATSPPLSPHIVKDDEPVEEIVEDPMRLTTSEVRECAVVTSPTPSPPLQEPPSLIPSALESAIKAEPKVEVELAPRLPSPAIHTADSHEERDEAGLTPQTRLYLGTTSRQNLETIVEAIRHLEGDHLFGDDPPHHHHHLHHLHHHHHHLQEVQMRPESPQDVPLALTTQVVGPPSPCTLPVEEHLGPPPPQDYSSHLPPHHSTHHLSTLTSLPPPKEEEEEVAVDLGCYRPPSGATSVLALAPPTNSHTSSSPPHPHHHFEVHPLGPLHRRHQLPAHAQQHQQQRPGVIVVKPT